MPCMMPCNPTSFQRRMAFRGASLERCTVDSGSPSKKGAISRLVSISGHYFVFDSYNPIHFIPDEP